MEFSVIAVYDRGRRRSEQEPQDQVPVVGDLRTYWMPETHGEPARLWASFVHGSECKDLLKPLLEPRLTGSAPLAFALEGFEALDTKRGKVYVRQEWMLRQLKRVRGDDPMFGEIRSVPANENELQRGRRPV
jgi:hypothetical protein